MSTIYTDAMREKGAADAADFQTRSASMTGTEMYAEEEKIPDFQAAKAKMNMLKRKTGFICKSSAGRVVKLLQPYDSDIYTSEPEELEAQWGFKWSTDPTKALPFIQKSTSTYGVGECCTALEHVWSSKIDGNNWSPETSPQFWNDLGTIEDVMNGSYELPDSGGEVVDPEPEPEDPYADVAPWAQPTGAHDAYQVGDIMRYTDGHVYKCKQPNCVYGPDVMPNYWELLA